jgi:hypothetical protein
MESFLFWGGSFLYHYEITQVKYHDHPVLLDNPYPSITKTRRKTQHIYAITGTAASFFLPSGPCLTDLNSIPSVQRKAQAAQATEM